MTAVVSFDLLLLVLVHGGFLLVAPCLKDSLRYESGRYSPNKGRTLVLLLAMLASSVMVVVSAIDIVASLGGDDTSVLLLSCQLLVAFVWTWSIRYLWIHYSRNLRPLTPLVLWWFICFFAFLFRCVRVVTHNPLAITAAGEFIAVIQICCVSVCLLCGIITVILRRFDTGNTFEMVIEEGGESTSQVESKPNWFAKSLFWWLNPLMALGSSRPLQQEDLPQLSDKDSTGFIEKAFESAWNRQRSLASGAPSSGRPHTASIAKALGACFGPYFAVAAIFKITSDLSNLAGPVLLHAIVRSLQRSSTFAANNNDAVATNTTSIETGPTRSLYSVTTIAIADLMSPFVDLGSDPTRAGRFMLSNEDTVDVNLELELGYIYVLILFVICSCASVIRQQYMFRCFRVAMNIRTAVVSAVYRKALRLSVSARQHRTVGEMVNLLSADAARISEVANSLHHMWSSPILIFLALTMIYQLVGVAALSGAVVLCVMIPINNFLVRYSKKLQRLLMKVKDERIRLTNEVLANMKIVKYSAWEQSCQDRICAIRSNEIKQMRHTVIIKSITDAIWLCLPLLCSVTTFSTYAMLGNELDAATIFSALAVFNVLRMPMVMIANMFSSVLEGIVSAKRVQEFLCCEEIDPKAIERSDDNYETARASNPKPALEIHNASFSWLASANTAPELSNVNLTVSKGELVCVVGAVGAGKTSLLSAILGEMNKLAGSAAIRGRVAYVSQSAFIMNESLEANVLFGRARDADKYNRCIDVCSLQSDIAILPAGDKTDIGEKGINLSGGQKQRISLARAVYADADIYLMDDPLSAVDVHVGQDIFDRCIVHTLSNRTRLLVTHAVHLLPMADRIIVMKDGRIEEVGSYKELASDPGSALNQFIRHYEDSKQHLQDSSGGTLKNRTVKKQKNSSETVSSTSSPRAISPESEDANPDESTSDSTNTDSEIKEDANEPTLESIKPNGFHPKKEHSTALAKTGAKTVSKPASKTIKFVKEEERSTGHISLQVYLAYLQAVGGYAVAALILIQFSVIQGSTVCSSWFLSYWTNHKSEHSQNYFLSIYISLGSLVIVLMWWNSLIFGLSGLRAGQRLHAWLLQAMLRAPLTFFDTTPLGRIMTRFSYDQQTIDMSLPVTIQNGLITSFSVLSTLIVITAVTPVFFLMILPLLALYRYTERYFVKTSREVKRLDSISRGPIFAHFGETLGGTAVIRAYRDEARFTASSDMKLDENQRCVFMSNCSTRWLGVRLDVVGTVVVTSAGLLALWGRNTVDPSLAGLSLSYALTVTQMLNLLVRMNSDREAQCVAVERFHHYMKVTPEADEIIESNRPDNSWPREGRVVFKDVCMAYRPDLPLVLNQVNFEIAGSEKIGVCGRTGAGKSSIMCALFRIVEVSSGSILVDGLDISKIGLRDLRSRLSIIPQEPVLFSGTMRYNLDPFGNYNDEQLWHALAMVNLKSILEKTDDGLDCKVAENGENWSLGQRQLICLARTFLKRSKIIVLDEATASCDVETDAFVQKALREMFATCTVLTIAHRLHTIADSDKILLMDQGRIAEFDTPTNLLALPNSRYRAMLEKHSH